MAILHDHLEVPSSTACSTAFMFSRCALAEMLKTVLTMMVKMGCKEEECTERGKTITSLQTEGPYYFLFTVRV